MKVHVTGAGGFIGRNLMSALARSHHHAAAAVAGADAVIHLAAIAHRHASRDELDEVNVRLPARLAREAAACGARFLFLSSVKVHGERSEHPFTERSAIAPADPYAASKARAEEALHAVSGLPLAILRPPLVYGPGVKANFLSLMRAVARGCPLPLGSVNNRRSLVYVGNLVDAIVRCLTVDGTYLVSDGEAVSTAQLCRELGEVLGRPARLVPFPPALLPAKLRASLEVNDHALRERLGWMPPHGRAAGMRATADWYLRR